MRLALTVVLAALITGPVQAGSDVPQRASAHVRTIQPEGEQLLTRGLASSPTFRRLVDRLEHSDVIVYIDLRSDMPQLLGGSLQFLARSATNRFVRIRINRANSRLWQTALLGHELQHAVEVADSSDVESTEGLRALYRRIGVRMGQDAFDSLAAQHAGFAVRAELSGARGDLRFARADKPEGGEHMSESLGDDVSAPAVPVSTQDTYRDSAPLM